MSAANSRLPECDLDVTDSLPTVEARCGSLRYANCQHASGIETRENHGDAVQPICYEVWDDWTSLLGDLEALQMGSQMLANDESQKTCWDHCATRDAVRNNRRSNSL